MSAEAELVAAVTALLDASEARLAEVYEMNRRVRAALLEITSEVRLCLEDGSPDVMRAGLRAVVSCLSSLADDPHTIIVEWPGQ